MASVRPGISDAGARTSRADVTLAWWSICSAMYYLFIGATLARSYGAINTLAGSFIGAISLGLLTRVFVRHAIAARSGSSMLSQAMLGKQGGSLPTLILFASCVYYAVFEGSVLAITVSKVLKWLSYGSAAVLVTIIGAGVAATKLRGLFERVTGFLLPLYCAGIVLLVALPLLGHGTANYSWLNYGSEHSLSMKGLSACVVSYLSLLGFCMISMDFAVEGRREDMAHHARMTFGIPFYLVTLTLTAGVGIFLAGAVDRQLGATETGLVDVCLSILGAGWGLVWLFATQTRINSANFYVACTNLRAGLEGMFRIRLGMGPLAVGVGIIVWVLMRSTDVFSYILAALRVQGVFLAAWTGMAVIHIAAGRNRRLTPAGTGPAAVRWKGVTSWSCGVAMGLAALWGTRVLAPWSLLVSAAGAAAAHSLPFERRRRSRLH